MKINVTLLFLLTGILSFSQNTFQNGAAPNSQTNAYSALTRIDYARIIVPKKKNTIEGTVYAFKKWENLGTLHVGDKSFELNNINYNMRTNSIESKVGKDSIYIFDLNNIDYAFINNRKFKSFYFDGENKIFEVLQEGDKSSFLKGYTVDIQKKDVDPLMVKKKNAKYVTNRSYYYLSNDEIVKISLKKKTILKLFGDKAEMMKKYAKSNKLSLKREGDLKKIFNHYQSL